MGKIAPIIIKFRNLLAPPRILEGRENFWKIVKKWQSKGWEISMHGYNHLYKSETYKNDYFKYGGKSEFFGKTLADQTSRIQRGLEIFKKNES